MIAPKHLFVALLATLWLMMGCKTTKAESETKTPNISNMDTIPPSDYAKAWAEIDSLDQKGLPKSALAKVDSLFEVAMADKNAAQEVKCLVYRLKYRAELEEYGLENGLNSIEASIDLLDFPAKPIMQVYLANFYESYLQQNQWKINERTETVNYKNDDISTWTTEQIIAKIAELYDVALNVEGLDEIKISKVSDLVTYNSEEKRRETLFDILAFEAIDFFSDEKNYLTQPAYSFQLADVEAFADVKSFVNHSFETRDSSSHKRKALLIFQKVLDTHKDNPNKWPLLDANLLRLSFVLNNSVHPEKNALYKEALLDLTKQYAGNELVTLVNYELANVFHNEGRKYAPKPFYLEDSDEGQSTRFKIREAANICEKAINEYPNSLGAKKCANLLFQIKQKELSSVFEEVVTAQKPLLGKISFKNVEQYFFKIVPVSEEQKVKIQRTIYNNVGPILNAIKPVKSGNGTLPDTKDFQSHSTEIALPKLDFGQYYIMISDNPDFDDSLGPLSIHELQVSNIALINISNKINDEANFLVVDRNTGAPLDNVAATFYVNEYSKLKREYSLKKIDSVFTDENGFLKNTNSEGSNTFRIKLVLKDDVLFSDEFFSISRDYERPNRYTTEFFLDRKIYRPGQTIHFKAIVLEKDQHDVPSIVPGRKIAIAFKDQNNQVVENVELETNEYGTCSGSFIAPTGGLLGEMSILASGSFSGYTSLRVEEYKRPKFEVTINPVEQEVNLGDLITITGNAKAYAGYPIDNGTVQYRVVRQTNYPYWPWWRWGRFYPQSASMEISNGQAKTDAGGNFTIDFKAIPDLSIDKDNNPLFNFTIYADVTDEAGETRSNQFQVNIGYTSLQLAIEGAASLKNTAWDSLKLTSTNLQGVEIQSEVKIEISKLKTPAYPVVDRYWDYPDIKLLSDTEYGDNFPALGTYGEENPENWKIGQNVFTLKTSIKGNASIALTGFDKKQGAYLIAVSANDKTGKTVETRKIIKILDENNDQPAIPSFFDPEVPKESFEAGEQATIRLLSSLKDQKVFASTGRLKNSTKREWVSAGNSKKLIIPILKDDQGNISLSFTWVRNNRYYHQSHIISVPWKGKDLELNFETFRDKLEPGLKESWNIKISGEGKDKIAAEMLVSMYDASLDAFAPNSWNFSPFPILNYREYVRPIGFNVSRNYTFFSPKENRPHNIIDYYPQLNFRPYNLTLYGNFFNLFSRNYHLKHRSNAPVQMEEMVVNGAVEKSQADAELAPPRAASQSPYDETVPDDAMDVIDNIINQPPVRTNLKETVFFFPDLKTDKEGNIIFSFTMNEALTKWKFMGLAHTKELASGIITKEVVTQKDLMVVPNPPRFFREGDAIFYSAKVVNLSDKDLEGKVRLELLDAISGNPVNTPLGNNNPELSFQIKAGSSESYKWPLQVPLNGVQAITHRVVAKAGNFSDGEESALPVLTNRMLVTESLPLPLRGESEGTFVLKNLRDNSSNTLTHERMTLEFTQNPAWYAVKSLPYLMEYPYECTEQIFSRYYANALASHVANAHPKIKRVFDAWKNYQPDALESQLTKNQELKSALLEETPWVLQAQSEAAQRKNIGLLFDLNRMANEKQNALRKLAERQEGNGGWSWFPGGRPSWYITQYLVEGIGRLDKMGVEQDRVSEEMLRKAVGFIDFSLQEHYRQLLERVERGTANLADDHLDNIVIHYLYARSFFLKDGNWKATNSGNGKYPINKESNTAIAYYLVQAKKYAFDKGIYQQGMLALSLQRWEAESDIPAQLVKSLKERSLNNAELGMYWKYPRGWWWYLAPIETHSLMIEVFDEVAKDPQSVDDLKVWLLKNKQTTHWKTTKATANAVYALLMSGDNWLLEDKPVSFDWAGENFKSSDFEQEAGSGYFKTSWSGDYLDKKEKEVGKEGIASIQVENPNKNVAWGSMYWQYFEQLDKITTFEETPLTLKKDIFNVVNTDTGEKLQSLEKNDGVYSKIKVGDKLKIRIELRVDRDMEYVHLKDMRAAGLEPIQVLSQYKWQDGLGYYESPGDVATNFFFSYLPKGTYVFEYPLRVQHAGDFSNGISNIQCMYAPEFTSHSAGVRLKVE